MVLLALAVSVLTAALLWRWRAQPPVSPEAAGSGALGATPLPGPASQEEFSAAERQRLDDILRRRNKGAP